MIYFHRLQLLRAWVSEWVSGQACVLKRHFQNFLTLCVCSGQWCVCSQRHSGEWYMVSSVLIWKQSVVGDISAPFLMRKDYRQGVCLSHSPITSLPSLATPKDKTSSLLFGSWIVCLDCALCSCQTSFCVGMCESFHYLKTKDSTGTFITIMI